MEYFDILHLKKEPFSNSPDPEFFFHNPHHVHCLQKLELAIRLRRGLNVIIGDVGTGKTTLCRQLLIQFDTPTDTESIESHLVLDPSFSSPMEFLTVIAGLFGLPMEKESELHLKEKIKQYLFDGSVHDDKIVVVIIDEGQKIPEFCLETLRELLNYETNRYKLLQILIFAQKEFLDVIKKHANFVDRINQYIQLEPLTFAETRKMIHFRMTRASGEQKPPSLFTLPALVAIQRATHGYPRKIITLCHQALLAMIIQNRSRVGWSLVWSCARRTDEGYPLKSRWGTAFAAAAVVLLCFAALWMNQDFLKRFVSASTEHLAISPIKTVAPASVQHTEYASVIPVEPVQNTSKDHQYNSSIPADMPDILGSIKLIKGDTTWRVLYDVYGDSYPLRFKQFVEVNSHIKNVHHVIIGEILTIPAIPVATSASVKNSKWIQIDRTTSLSQGYRLLQVYSRALPSIELVPYWDPGRGFFFSLIVGKGFTNDLSAQQAMSRLPSHLLSRAKIITWSPQAVFIKNLTTEGNSAAGA